MKRLKISLSFLLTILLCVSCESDPKDARPTEVSSLNPPAPVRNTFQPESLIGNWVLTKATIDRVPTNRLDSAFFEFSEDNIIKTNVLGSDEEGTYALEGKTLTQNTAKTIEYRIEKLVPDSMVMSMQVAGKKFRVLLQK